MVDYSFESESLTLLWFLESKYNVLSFDSVTNASVLMSNVLISGKLEL